MMASESSNLSSSADVGSSNLSTSWAASSNLVSRCNVTLALEGRFSDLPRDFKSLVSRAPDCDSGCRRGHGFESRPVVAGMKTRCLSQQGFVTPRGSYPQNPVKNPNNPRINGTAFEELFTHKRNRFGLNPRINGTAFTHKRNRLSPSKPDAYWSTATSPVSTSITNNPIVKNKARISYAYEVDNL
jgi:hypothetical protein